MIYGGGAKDRPRNWGEGKLNRVRNTYLITKRKAQYAYLIFTEYSSAPIYNLRLPY